MSVFSDLQSMNRTELKKWLQDLVINARIWLQEHGEFALVVGVTVGVLAVVAFKLLILLVVAAAIGVGLLFYMAPEAVPAQGSPREVPPEIKPEQTPNNTADFKVVDVEVEPAKKESDKNVV